MLPEKHLVTGEASKIRSGVYDKELKIGVKSGRSALFFVENFN